MKNFVKGMYQKENFKVRLITVILAVICMGFSLSWLVLVDFGTDPCSAMNLAISKKIGMSLGNWQALLNIILLIFVVMFGCNDIGFGTLANMFLVGYSLDFFSWVWSKVLPDGLFDSMIVRILVLIPALIFFIISAAVYMDVKLGTAPYDSIPFIFARWFKNIPFKYVRMGFDFSVILISVIFGGKFGIVTVLMAFTLGPVITYIGKKIEVFIKIPEDEM